MPHNDVSILTLHLPARVNYLPAATQFVGTTAAIFDLDKAGGLQLELATEEIFAFLCREIRHGEILEIQCRNGLYHVRVTFRFASSSLNLGAFNMTATFSAEGDLGDMGLVIAARSIDRFNLAAESRRQISLSIEKDKRYPSSPDISFPPLANMEGLKVISPDAETLKRFIVQTAAMDSDPLRPPYLRYPGKVVDMIASGDCHALVAVTSHQAIAGGLLLFPRADRIIELIGPYAFHAGQASVITHLLLDACFVRAARTKSIAMLSRAGLPVSCLPQFEALGELQYYGTSGNSRKRSVFYRLLHEDPGCVIWTAAVLRDYLTKEYERLYLAREIREVRDDGEARSGVSVFSATLDRSHSEAILHPMWPGADETENVKKHLQCFHEESICNIFFELDLGIPWQASLIPVLLATRFEPALLIPFAGQSDILVLQYHGS